MNEEALNRLFILAENDGYKKSFEEFKVLMSSNEDAINTMYGLAKGDGYRKDINEFKTLVGFDQSLKKKEETLAPTGSDLEVSGQPATGTPALESDLTSQPSEPFISRLPSAGSMSNLPSELKDKVKETLPDGSYKTPEEKTNQYQRPEISREEMMSSFTEGVEGVGEKRPIVTLEGRETSTIKQPYNRMVDDRFKTPEYKPEEDKMGYQEMMSSFYEGVEDDVENLPGTSVEEREKILRDREKFLKERSEFRENYIKEAYIDEIVKTGVSREYAENYLTKLALNNYIVDPEGEGITKDPVASLKDVDKDEVMAYRDKLAEQQLSLSGKTLKDITVAKYIENNDGDVEVAQEKFFEGMNAVSELFLSDSEKQIKGLKESVYRLESFENLPEEKRILLEKGKAELQRFIDEGLIGSGDLYDYKTGQFVSGNTKDERIIAFNNELKKKKSMYENTDLGQLIKDRDDSYFKFEAFLNQALEESLDLPGLSGGEKVYWAKRFGLIGLNDGYAEAKFVKFNKDQAMQIIRSEAESPFNFSGMDVADSSISDSMKILNSEVLDPAITKKAEELLATFMATNSQIALNEDRSSREKYMDFQKYTDELRKFGGAALEAPAAVLDMMSGTGVPEGVIKGFKESMGATSMSELDQSRRAIERLSSMGYDLTDDQKEVMEVTTAEKFSEAAGGMIPVMVELAATSMVTGGLGNALKIPKLLETISAGSKALEKGLKFSYKMGMQGLNYEIAGQSFSSGVGEFLGESVGEGLIKALGSKNPILNVLSKAIFGAGGETMAEYSGEFVERLVEDDDTFSQALDKTIGTAETAGEKLATTYFLSLMMSSTIGMTGVNAEWRKDIENTRRDLESQAEDSELIRNVLDKTKGLESNLRVMAEAEKRIRERDGLEPDAEISEKDLMSEVSTIMNEGNKKISDTISSSISDVLNGDKSLADAFDEASKTTGADLIIEEQFGKLETEADKKAAMLLMAYNADAKTKSNPEFVNWYKATEKELSGLEKKSEIVEAALAVQEQDNINQQKQTDDVQEQQAKDVEVGSGQEKMQEPDVEQEQEKEVGVYTTEDIVESTDAKAFAEAQSSALSQRTDTKLQVDPTSEQDAQKIIDEGGKLFLTSDGKAGAYVTADGYMGGLFKDPNSNKNQASKALQEVRTKAGGKFFDAFGINPETGDGTTLEEIYVKNGFRPVARMPFDPDTAPKGWENTTLASRPDNVFFVYDPDYKAEVGEGETITDFDKAYEMAKNYEPTSASNSANKTVVEPGKRLFNEPNKETAEISKKYREEKGIEFDEGEPITELDEDLSKEIADAYEAMEDNPNDPEVKEAYDALASETVDQYKALIDAGYEVEIYKGEGEPYANSEEMIKDLKENKHIYIFSTEGGFGETGITDKQRSENAMLGSTEFKDVNGEPLLVNDLFRAVHDFFGHSERGNGFGAIGEENAWDVHARMFSDKARRAMTTETKGQNSWVNFGPQMRGKDGKILKKGDKGYLKPSERQFAEQKMGLLPEKYSEISSTKKDSATDIEETFEVADDVIPEVTEGALDLLNAFGKKPKKSKVTPKKRKQVLDQVTKAEKALSKVSPKTKIVVHETSKDYKSSGRNRNQNEGGVYEVDAEGNGTIHINLESANERTVAHEVFHALLLSKGMGDKQAQVITNRMLNAVKKSASPELLLELEEFSKKYVLEDENGNPILDKNGNTIPDPVQSEESIAELFGILASEYDTLPRPTQNIIKRWLDKLAKLFGLKLFTDNEVVDMLNTVSRSVREGSVIEESDIDVIRRDPMLARDTRADFLGGTPVDELTDADLDQNQTRQWSDGRSQIGTATRKQITEESIKNSVVSDISADYTYVFDDYGREIVLPKKETVKNVLEKSGGYAVFINSDGTKVGVRSNGELLDGGWQYTFIKENVDSNIGFAATSETHVKTLHKMVSELTAQRDSVNPESKGKPIAVFVTVQNGETMLGEWYAGEYFFEGIDKAITENKFKNGVDTFRKLMTDALSFKSKINESRKKIRELKKQNQTNETKSKIEALKNRVIRFKKKASSRETVALLKLINSDKFKTHDGRIEIAKEFASKKFTFGFRVNLLKSLIPLKSATGGNNIIKKALLDVDHGRQEFYQEHLDGSLLNRLEETSYDETSIGGVTLGGFYMDPYVSKKKFFENRKNGIDHAQFNESFSSNGETFRLDKAHDVNKLNPYMGYPTANGYKVYNKENGTNINKKNASIKDRHDIVAYLDNKYGNKKDGKNLFALPFTSIGGSMYTPTDSEIEFNDSPKKPSRRRKQKPSGSTQQSRDQLNPNERTERLAPNGNRSNLTNSQYDSVRTPEFKKWFGDWENDPENASKVVDENGEPLVVYHGSVSTDIDIFDRSQSGRKSSGLKELGTYFSTNKDLADLYSKAEMSDDYKKSLNKKIKELEDLQMKVRSNKDFDAIENEIKNLKSQGRVYPVFLNLRNIHEFDANEETNIEAWRNLKVKASYKTAQGRDAMEFLSPEYNKNNEIESRFGVKPVDGVKATNIIDMSIGGAAKGDKAYNKARDRYMSDVYLVFDGQPQNIKLADGTNTTFNSKSRNIRKQKPSDRPSIESVREKAKEIGATEKDVYIALRNLGYTNAEIRSTQTKAITDAKVKYDLSIKRGNSKSDALKSAIADMQSTFWYSQATDTQRESAIRELRKELGQKEKKAPSVKKVLGKGSDKKVTMNEKTALKNQIRMEARAAKDSKRDQDSKRRAISEIISDIISESEKDSSVKTRKLNAIQKKINRTNLNNPVMVERLVNYIEKVISDADHITKMAKVDKVRSRIKKMSKKKGLDANLSASAKSFSMIDPNLVENIDEYIEKANEVYNGLKSTSITPSKKSVATRFNTSEINEYTEKALSKQDELIKESVEKHFEDLTGISGSEMTMKDMLKAIERAKDSGADPSKLEAIEKSNIKEVYDVYASIVSSMTETNTDPFTGESLGLDKNEIGIAKRLANLDVLNLTKAESIKAIDALSNFVTNQSLAGVEAIVSKAEGRNNAKTLKSKGVKSRPLKLYFSKRIGRLFAEQFTSLPIAMERMFGRSNARRFAKASGLTGVINGNAKANKQASNIISKYLDKFSKTKPNGEVFNSRANINERGLLAFMSRTVEGESDVEFERRKGLIEQSIEALEKGTKDDQQIADGYKEVYNKLLKGSSSIDQVRSKADNKNVEAVDWWVDEWSKHYEDLQKTNLEVYNEILGEDVNYTPDVFKRVDVDEEIELDQSSFAGASGYLDKSKSGSLLKATRPSKLPKNAKGDATRYINLDFDANNSNMIQAALTDINTAKDIMKLEGFLNSPDFKDIVANKEDQDLIDGRIKDYVRNVKGSNYTDRSEMNNLSKAVEFVAALGVSKALGGVTQAVKQSVPVAMNTIVNSGRMDLSLISNPEVRSFIDNSGMPIANRGIASQASLDHIDRLLEEAASSTGKKLVKKLEDLNRFYLKMFLQNSDVFVARASFISYYKQALKRKGKEVGDWGAHEMDKDAADYAQQQVDRQQNVSDEYLQGKFFSSKEPIVKMVRKVAFPFANFAVNQKARMQSDVIALASKDTSKEDRIAAARSLGGLATEMAMFYSLSILLRSLIWEGAKSATDYDESDEEKEKRMHNQLKGSLTSIAKDIVSPSPVLDAPVMKGINSLLMAIQGSESKKEAFQLYEDYDRGVWDDWGVIGISMQKAEDMLDKSEVAITGEYEDRYGNKKEVNQRAQDDMKLSATLSILYNVGLLPSEFGSMADYIEKISKKRKKKK